MGLNVQPEGSEREVAARRELFAVLAHELRSPIGAILGFEELLSEGIFGEVSESGHDALTRIRSSARQLLDLVAGLNDLAMSTGETAPVQRTAIAADSLLDAAFKTLEPEAAGRGTQVQFIADPLLPSIMGDAERVQRALQLALMASVKTTAGGALCLRARAEGGALLIEITGTRLEPLRDEPDLSLMGTETPRLTAAGLRIAMARHALAPLQGEIALEPGPDGVTLRLLLPALARD